MDGPQKRYKHPICVYSMFVYLFAALRKRISPWDHQNTSYLLTYMYNGLNLALLNMLFWSYTHLHVFCF